MESGQLCRAVPDAVTELGPERSVALERRLSAGRVRPSGHGRGGCEAAEGQKRLSEDLSSIRRMRAWMPAAIVAAQLVRHRSPLRALRTRGIVINNAPSQTELSQKAASLSFEALERFPKVHFRIQKMNHNGLCRVPIGTVQRSDRRMRSRIAWVRRPLFDRILQMSHPFHGLASRNNHELVDTADSHAASKGNR
jgi:hypothetical protein